MPETPISRSTLYFQCCKYSHASKLFVYLYLLDSRSPDKSAIILKIIFLISQPDHGKSQEPSQLDAF